MSKVSPSGLMTFWGSPAHYHERYILGERETTPAMEFGILVHEAILEPDVFDQKYQVPVEQPEGLLDTMDDLRVLLKLHGLKVSGKKDDLLERVEKLPKDNRPLTIREWQAEQYSSKKEVLPLKTWKKIERMRDAVWGHSWFKKILPLGKTEQYFETVHKDTGIQVRGRLDWFSPECGAEKCPIVIDLKTSNTAHPRAWQSKVYQDGLFLQAAIYHDIILAEFGVEPLYVWCVVESSAPYICEAYAADYGTINAGQTVYNSLIHDYKRCLESNNWPGYTRSPMNQLALPNYALNSIEEKYSQPIGEDWNV